MNRDFPDSKHARNVNMRGATDSRIWNYCKENGFTIVSKNTDFRDRSFVKSHPPKIIWLDVGNAGTKKIAELVHSERSRVERFIEQERASLLILSIGKNAV